MVKLLRIDDRLVHGQVAFTWTPALGVDGLFVANDRVAKDEFLRMTLGLAKPAGAKLLIKSIADSITWLNDAKNKGQQLLVLVDSVKDAHVLAMEVGDIRSINFGGIRAKTGARPVSKAIALSDNDIILIRELLAKGLELEVRQVPTDKKEPIENLL
ncbi:PTS sugar transporter subunit IIB [Puia sp.]|jgi:mannose/fructose/N-acetylgalactosamine-specific phosphotransferase system component IIB|uniref:PTS system mannose/fructose/N-acetylgalactosamine-transporter subunit IIB n=1 Tax=Puia sp. TaxID=2045100 RepID=UPI002F42AA27